MLFVMMAYILTFDTRALFAFVFKMAYMVRLAHLRAGRSLQDGVSISLGDQRAASGRLQNRIAIFLVHVRRAGDEGLRPGCRQNAANKNDHKEQINTHGQFADLKPMLKPPALRSLVVHATPVLGLVVQSVLIQPHEPCDGDRLLDV